MPIERIAGAVTAADMGASIGASIDDLLVVDLPGVTYVYAVTSDANDGLVLLELDADGALVYRDNLLEQGELADGSYYTPSERSSAPGLVAGVVDGQYVLIGVDTFADINGDPVNNGVHIFDISGDGSLTLSGRFDRTAGSKSSIMGVQVEEAVLLYEVQNRNAGVNDKLVVSDLDGGTFTITSTSTLTSTVVDEVFTVGEGVADNYFFYRDETTNGIHWISYSNGSSSSLLTAEIPNTRVNNAEFAVTDMEMVQVGGSNYLITTNPFSGIRSYFVPNNAFFVEDFETRDLVNTRNGEANWAATDIATFSIDGRGFLAVGGKNMTMFEIESNGELSLVDRSFLTLAEVTDLDVDLRDGTAVILATAADGVHSFEFTPGPAKNRNGTNGADEMNGDARDNRFVAFGGDDVLRGYDGADQLYGNGGRDRLFGGDDGDRLSGGKDNDLIGGGNGNDQGYGGTGADRIYGQNGNDRLRGGDGNDLIYGGNNTDFVWGDAGNDRAYGDAGNDVMSGGFGDDQMFGGDGADKVYGSDGKDILSGGSGEDTLYGGAGYDRITDGADTDLMYGGGGPDRFIFVRDREVDFIEDWTSRDVIDLRAFGPELDFADLRFRYDRELNTVSISFAQEDIVVSTTGSLLLASSFSADDFLFA